MNEPEEISIGYAVSAPWIVAKFGGTSVSSLESWRSILRIVTAHRQHGARVVIVCSAIARATDLLEALADAVEQSGDVDARLAEIYRIHDAMLQELGLLEPALVSRLYQRLERLARNTNPPSAARRRAEILATGELLSTSLGAQWLANRGLSVRWVDARTLLEATGKARDAQHYLSASCSYAPDPQLAAALGENGEEILITQGFLARDDRGDTVLLGRGGSDTSAAYLAAKLSASSLEIWTDVCGVFSGDPTRFSRARLLERLTFAEAQALAAMGARVLHPRCLEPARERGIPVRIGWTRHPYLPGTRIDDRALGEVGVKTVLQRSKLVLVTMTRQVRWPQVGFMAEIATRFQRHGLSIDLIGSSPGEIRATIDLSAHPRAEGKIAALLADLGDICQPRIERDVVCVSVTGSSTRSAIHKLSNTLQVLGDPRVHLVSYAADDSHVSFVVAPSLADQLIDELHAELFERVSKSPVFGPTFRELEQMAKAQPGVGQGNEADSVATG